MLANNFKKSLLAVNVGIALGAGFSGVVVAEESQSQNQVQENVEVIEVRGIRRSLKESINTKRFATSVVDAVSAEDIGKFPDSDVGEALGRIPGVAVNRQFGQGQQVSIRGASNQLTLTTLNGQSVASTGWYDQQAIDRSFNYTLLPPQLISAIEVFKSSQADLVEGGVGGTVNVKTRKPLDLDSNSAFFSVEGEYSTESEETDPGLSALYSWKNADETFGVMGAVAYEDSTYVRRGNEASYGWDGAESVNYFEQQRERTSIDITAQYAPTENSEFVLHYLGLELEADNANNSIFLFTNLNNCEKKIAVSDVCTVRSNTAENPAPNRAFLQTFARFASMESEVIDLAYNYHGDNFKVETRLGSTSAEGGTDLTINHAAYLGTAADLNGLVLDNSGKVSSVNLPKGGWNISEFDPSWDGRGLQNWASQKAPNKDEETYFQADLTYNLDHDYITSIKAGVRWTDHEVERDSYRPTHNAHNTIDPTQFWTGSDTSGTDANVTIPTPDINAMRANAEATFGTWYHDRSGYSTVEEENLAIYLMANYSGENYRGNFGLRYVSTDASSKYFAPMPGFVDPNGIGQNNGLSSSIVEDKGDYSEILPSFNLAYDLSEDSIVRVSLAQVISRPNYNDMFAATQIAGYGDTQRGNETLTKGNPNLKPFKATQADLGYEYYYGDANMVAITLFYKDVSNFTTSETTLNQSVGIVDPVTGQDNWQVNTQVDGDGGDILGFEFQVQHELGGGFGTLFNYTYADGSVDESNFSDAVGLFSDSSENTINAVAYYEQDDVSVRLAYNWRSKYMIRETGFYGNRMHDDYGSLDLTASYNVTDAITLRFAAVNLTEEDSVQYGVAEFPAGTKPSIRDGYAAWSYKGDARYSLGVDFRF
ncbi:TonB-dependent receptor [Pseudoalteromonas maricaloris]|uniref:TonB-dependent receptor n=1 Tax=Pseudoalteromonas maricaloris TaxID=184924 RepID=UPI0021AE178E|nr:TonB-dependent receptor [Pseudoalteromonas flavipulchra]USE68845.1 TonB-dependent receptor [Pseudoalteromonas flavipulchra]